MQQANNGELNGDTYIPIRRNTPKILIENALIKNGDEIDDYPLIMQVKKAIGHSISEDDMISIIKAMDDPLYIVYQEYNDRYVEVVRYNNSQKSTAVAVLEIGGYKDSLYLNGFKGGAFNFVVTAFVSDADYLSDTILTKKIIE